MPLRYKYKKKDEVPKEHEALYVEKTEKKDGADVPIWTLDVEGAVDADRLQEFRSNNIKLTKEFDAYKERFEGIDPEEFSTLKESVGSLKPAEVRDLLKKGTDVEKLVTERTKQMQADNKKALDAKTAELEKTRARLTQVEINQATVAEATKRGLKPTAILDITARAQMIFRLSDDGKVLAYEADGKTPRYGKDGLTPLTISEWLDVQVTEAPHLFEASGGGGAGPGAGGGAGGGSGGVKGNPWKRGTPEFNLTHQITIAKTNPQLAARLKAEAGVQ